MLGVGYRFSMSHHAVSMLVVSEAHNLTADPSTVCDCGYRAHGELAGFTYCLLQKIKSTHSLPLIKKWEQNLLPNHSRFPPIKEKEFLAGSLNAVALEKLGRQFLTAKRVPEWCPEVFGGFHKHFVATVAAWSDCGQGPNYFCPEIVIGGFGQFLDGLMKLSAVHGSNLKASKTEY